MSNSKARLIWLAIPFALGLGAAGYAAGTAGTEEAPAAPACAIDVHTNNGMYALEAQFLADGPANGQYTLSVKSVGGANRTSIHQGGGFSAPADQTTVLGRTMLGGNGVYDVTLTVNANGKTYECHETLGQGA